MDDLQSELQASQEVTDAIYKGLSLGVDGMDPDDEATLIGELNSLLRDTGEEEVSYNMDVLNQMPHPPSTSVSLNLGGAMARSPRRPHSEPLLA